MSAELQLLAKTIRIVAAEGVDKAKSGHPGLPMGAADYASLLWSEYLRFNPEDPSWPARDRFVLSAGHGSMLLYTLLHLFGYKMGMDQLQSFRQWGSLTPGHPEFGITEGVEATTGPLGQGFANGVGMAMSAKMLAARYGDLFNHRVYALVSDGDLMEGISSEAGSLAGHLGLNNLVYFYDDNKICLAGPTGVCFTESVQKRFEAFGWFVQSVDGHNPAEVRAAVEKALAEKERPNLICCRTTIGFGSPHKANDSEVHGAPLGPEELEATKKNLDWIYPPFTVPAEVSKFCAAVVEKRKQEYASWQKAFADWQGKNPEQAKAWRAQVSRELPATLKSSLLEAFKEPKKDATRNLSGKALNVIARHVPALVGGSADLEPSTKTLIKDAAEIQRGQFAGRNIRYGVREHAMGGVTNGLAYGGCWFPYTATFLVFADYMRPTLRLAAMSHIQSLFIFTHDSFYVGEDGPTHEPIEQVASLRLIPNLYVFRPADGIETAMCYFAALQRKDRPAVMIATRQDLPPLERPQSFTPDDVLKGAYLAYEATNPSVTIVATGSEVWVAVDAAKQLSVEGIQASVVSMPCVELFREQSKEYQQRLLPGSTKKISLEAGTTVGWQQIIGDGLRIGIDHYGASAPAGVLAEKFGFTPKAVKENILGWIKG